MEVNRANSNLSPSWRELFAIQRKTLRYSSSASNICCRATRRSGPGPSLGRRSESRVVIPANLQSSFKWVTRRDSWDANCTPQSQLRGRQIRRTRIWKARPRTSVQKFSALQIKYSSFFCTDRGRRPHVASHSHPNFDACNNMLRVASR